jgi:RNA polymerase sigma factor (sigma-70 family)
MLPQEQEFRELLREIQQGSQEAARDFLDRYGEHILRVIRRRLDQKMRPKFDSCDFLQDVLASFFHNPPPPDAFAGPEALFRYLTIMARNKVITAVRGRMQLKKHNVNRENSLDGSAKVQAGKVLGPEPTPSEMAVANEQWGGMLKGQPGHLQQVLHMLRQGHSHVEIAQELNLNVKMVQRLVQKLRPRFQA